MSTFLLHLDRARSGAPTTAAARHRCPILPSGGPSRIGRVGQRVSHSRPGVPPVRYEWYGMVQNLRYFSGSAAATLGKRAGTRQIDTGPIRTMSDYRSLRAGGGRTCRRGVSAGSMYGQGDVAKRSKAEVCKTSIRRFESARRLHTPPHLRYAPVLAAASQFVPTQPASVVRIRSPDAPTPPEQACRAHLELPVCVGYRPLGVVRAGVRVFPDVANSRRRAEAVHG